MKKATIWSIGKTLFGYDFLAEETEWTLHSVFKIVKEFGSCKKSPVRKSHIGIFFWAAKQKALHCVQYMLWLVQNVLEARHNKLVEEQMKVVVLNELNTLRRCETMWSWCIDFWYDPTFFWIWYTSNLTCCMHFWWWQVFASK
jgi:hypothetical protein